MSDITVMEALQQTAEASKSYTDSEITDLNKITMSLEIGDDDETVESLGVQYTAGGELPSVIINSHVPTKAYMNGQITTLKCNFR